MTEPSMTMANMAILSTLEKLCNYGLSLDECSQQKIAGLADHVFLFECTEPSFSLYIQAQQSQLQLLSMCELPVTSHLKGSWNDYQKLLTSDDAASELINGNLELHGKSEPLIQLQSIIKDLDIDWEAPLVEVLGDVAGHQLATGLRQGADLFKRFSQQLKQSASTYLRENSHITARETDLNEFYDDVDTIKLRTDRLEAKLTMLFHNTDN